MYSTQIKRALLILSFLITCFSLSSQEQQVQLDWERVSGAEEYRVHIEYENGDPLYEITVQEPPLYVSLFQGKYRFKIQVYNKFGQFLSETPWKELEVRQAMIPELGKAELDLWYSNHGGFTSTIMARGIEPDARFTLVKEDVKLELVSEALGNDRFRLELTEEIPAEGDWMFSVENPSGTEAISPVSLKVKSYRIPVIEDFSRNSFSKSEIFPVLEIRGSGFEESTRVILRSEINEQESPTVEFVNENKLKIPMDTQNMSIGPYHLRIENENGEMDEYPYAIEISKNFDDENTGIPNSGRQTRSFSALAGITLGVPLYDTNEELTLSSPGYSMRLETMINNGLQKNSAAINPIAVALTLSDINYKFKNNQAIMLKDQSLTFDISYLMAHKSRIRPGLLIGGGLSLSHLLNTDLSIHTSLDFHYIAGGFINIDSEGTVFFRHSLIYKQNLYLYENSHQIINVLSLGIWIK